MQSPIVNLSSASTLGDQSETVVNRGGSNRIRNECAGYHLDTTWDTYAWS